jgi:hypothetical protein
LIYDNKNDSWLMWLIWTTRYYRHL